MREKNEKRSIRKPNQVKYQPHEAVNTHTNSPGCKNWDWDNLTVNKSWLFKGIYWRLSVLTLNKGLVHVLTNHFAFPRSHCSTPLANTAAFFEGASGLTWLSDHPDEPYPGRNSCVWLSCRGLGLDKLCS